MPLERSRSDLLDAARRSELALAFEAAIDDTATVARRGASSWRLARCGTGLKKKLSRRSASLRASRRRTRLGSIP